MAAKGERVRGMNEKKLEMGFIQMLQEKKKDKLFFFCLWNSKGCMVENSVTYAVEHLGRETPHQPISTRPNLLWFSYL